MNAEPPPTPIQPPTARIVVTAIRPLSPRMLDVLRKIADGKTYAQISSDLGISVSVVKNYSSRLRDRLGASNTAEAVAIASRSGLIE